MTGRIFQKTSINEKAEKPDHTFCVLAYKKSPFIEECIRSLICQSLPGTVLLCTSTPSDFLAAIARKYEIEFCVNPVSGGIAPDWTFAYNMAQTRYVTLAHQDDLYLPGYTKMCYTALRRNPEGLLAFTGYNEIHNGNIFRHGTLVLVKKLILAAFFGLNRQISRKIIKKAFLSFGNPVACPTIMYNRHKIGPLSFDSEFKMNPDWEALHRLSGMAGDFVFVPERLLNRRIHRDSESTAAIASGKRHYEDLVMFEKFWPPPVARAIALLYSSAYGFNKN